ncbi:MAG: hypothetical protein ACO2PO_15310 [Candidatus Calescibacterium sp.]
MKTVSLSLRVANAVVYIFVQIVVKFVMSVRAWYVVIVLNLIFAIVVVMFLENLRI